MLSLSWNIFAERCRLRNSTPFPMDLESVGRGTDAVNGSKSSSRTKLPLQLQLREKERCDENGKGKEEDRLWNQSNDENENTSKTS